MFYHDVAALLKNAKYVAVIHVKINPEFNIYLDKDENVVALECLKRTHMARNRLLGNH